MVKSKILDVTALVQGIMRETGLTKHCMSFHVRVANCQPSLVVPFD